MIVWRGWQAFAIGAIGASAFVGPAGAAPITKFVSKQYHYSVVLPGSPGSWMLISAFVPWSQGALEPGAPQFDTLSDGRTAWFFIIGERKLATGSTLGKWTGYFLSTQALDCKRTSPISRSMLGGQTGSTFTFSCSDGVVGIGIDAVHGQGGYFMVLSTHYGSLDAAYRREFDAARSSFQFSGG